MIWTDWYVVIAIALLIINGLMLIKAWKEDVE